MVVTGQDGDAAPVLPVPDPDGLVVARRDDPGLFRVEVDGSDIVQVTVQREETPSGLVAVDESVVSWGQGNEWKEREREERLASRL